MHAGRSLALCAAMVLVAATCWAADGHEAPRWGDFGWRVLNFVLFFGILWYFTGKLIRKYFKGRRQQIKDGLDNLEQRRAEAKVKLADVEKRIANLEAERKAILDESMAQAERLKQQIIAEAQRQADQIVEQARLTAQNEGRAMLNDVRATIADEIVDAARKALVEKLDAKGHDALIAKALNKVVL